MASGPDRTRGVVEHSKLQSKRSNPNVRQQLGVLKEAVPSPPNHRGDRDGFLTCPRQVTIAGQDWASALAVVPEGPCQRLRGLMPHWQNYSLTECVRGRESRSQVYSNSVVVLQYCFCFWVCILY
jgi:hypothetical protein